MLPVPGVLVSAPAATGIAWVSMLRGADTLEVTVTVRNASAAAVTATVDHGGYAGSFQDPDGHLWEVAWNPQWPAEDSR